MPSIEIAASDKQISQLGAIIKALNKKGGFITASAFGQTIRATFPSSADISKLKIKLANLK